MARGQGYCDLTKHIFCQSYDNSDNIQQMSNKINWWSYYIWYLEGQRMNAPLHHNIWLNMFCLLVNTSAQEY